VQDIASQLRDLQQAAHQQRREGAVLNREEVACLHDSEHILQLDLQDIKVHLFPARRFVCHSRRAGTTVGERH